MPRECLLYIGSTIITGMSESAHTFLGKGPHWQVVTQLRYPNGNPGIGASVILHDSRGKYILASGSLNAEQIYEVGKRLSEQELLELANLGMSGMAPALVAHYNDQPLIITLSHEE